MWGQEDGISMIAPEVSLLKDEEKESIRDLLRRLSEALPGFVPREGQRRMIAEIARTFSHCRSENSPPATGRNLLTIQGPTGTGKTMAYLLAGLVLANSRKKFLVVSTATVSLQEQLVSKDLPLLAQVSNVPFSFELAKGRGRYLCERNLLSLTGNRYPEEAHWKRPPSPDEILLLDRMKERFGKGWNGDRDRWETPVPDHLWSGISNQASSCTSKRCDQYSSCEFFLRREEISRAHLVVANHDLVLSDLSLGGGVLLPKPEDSLYVFDEGHHLPGKSLSHFRAELEIEEALSWAERIPSVIAQSYGSKAGKEVKPPPVEETETLLETLQSLSKWFSSRWEGTFRKVIPVEAGGRPETLFGTGEEISSWRFPDGRIPEEVSAIASLGATASKILLDRVREIRDRFTEETPERKTEQGIRDRLLMDLGNLSDRLSGANQLLGLFGTRDPAGGPPTARWVVAHRRGGIRGHLLEASPVWPGSLLERMLWRRVSAAVVTSATLSTLGSFSSFSSRSGLSAFTDVSYIALSSPFRLEQQGVLRIPPLVSNPSDPVRHTEEVVQLLPGLLDPAGGSLVLFASRRQMEDVHRQLPKEWKDRILLQGERPRSEILELHARRISEGRGSVLFGLASFSEGLDLRGDLCTHVIIAKIPFSVPTDPIEETLAEWIRSRGGDPFREISLPDAGLRLVQAEGRLIRSENDSGTVTILDRRLVDKSYGPLLIRSLPPFRRESSETLLSPSFRNRDSSREDSSHDQ